jgi:hypothetical protein
VLGKDRATRLTNPLIDVDCWAVLADEPSIDDKEDQQNGRDRDKLGGVELFERAEVLHDDGLPGLVR